MDQRQSLKSRLERLLDYKEQEKQILNKDVNYYKAVQEDGSSRKEFECKIDASKLGRQSESSTSLRPNTINLSN